MKRGKSKNLGDVVVIVPAYNEGSVVQDNLNQILSIFPNVVCVNDGSRDDTLTEARKTKAIVLDHAINIGAGGATQTGIEYGLLKGCSFFATIDADGQHSVTDLLKMVEKLRSSKDIDIIFGSRFLGKRPEGISSLKKLFLRMAIKYSNLTSGVKMTDTHNGLRAFNRKTAEALDIQMSNYAHASELLFKIKANRLRYQEYPTTVKYTEYSKKKGQPAINAINVLVDSMLNKFN